MGLRTIDYKDNKVVIIDQTRLPARLAYLRIKKIGQLWQAIRQLKVRGAPALGAAAALGVYLGVKDSKARDFIQFNKELNKAIAHISLSRPTARNLFFALERVREVALKNREKPIFWIKKLILSECKLIMEEDRRACRAIARYGVKLIRDNDAILTICNAGILATIDYGTALGLIYRAKEEGRRFDVFACETRPLLQGSRLTMWELKRKRIDATLICDNTAARLMREGRVSKIITGADRIAANGDTANKIGTFNLAVAACYHRIPFYVVAPVSTFDLKIASGKEIPIEQRCASEITGLFFRRPVLSEEVSVYNPAFDVTPHELITAIVTDKGIIKPPYSENICRRIRQT